MKNKKSIILTLSIVLLFFVTLYYFNSSNAATESAAKVKWFTNYKDGMSLAKKNNKKVFLQFYADWCRYCVKMDKTTFADGSVSAYLNENFVPIRVMADNEQDLAKLYNVTGLPSAWFIDGKGEKISNLPGFVTADKLNPILKFIKTDSYKKMTFQQFFSDGY